jgi:predicted nucleotidyltransferase
MKTALDHMPEQKQQELQRVIEIAREEIDLEMLILFGSYARGDWVEDLDPETLQYRYQSDFDLQKHPARLIELSKTINFSGASPSLYGRLKSRFTVPTVRFINVARIEI